MNQDLNQPVTLGVLGEFTEQVLLPAVQEIVKAEVRAEVRSEIGIFRTEIKGYIDEKLGDLRGDLVSVFTGDRDRDRNFKAKVIDIIRRNKLAREDEISVLAQLAR